jgi:hypothetical protein
MFFQSSNMSREVSILRRCVTSNEAGSQQTCVFIDFCKFLCIKYGYYTYRILDHREQVNSPNSFLSPRPMYLIPFQVILILSIIYCICFREYMFCIFPSCLIPNIRLKNKASQIIDHNLSISRLINFRCPSFYNEDGIWMDILISVKPITSLRILRN